MMFKLLISQNELWLKIKLIFSLYHDILKLIILELQFLIQTVANKMCSWNIDAPDA